MRRPLAGVALWFAGGVALHGHALRWPLAVGALAGMLGGVAAVYGRARSLWLLLGPACLLSGYLYASSRALRDAGELEPWLGRRVVLQGIVAGEPDVREARRSFVVAVDRAGGAAASGKVFVADRRPRAPAPAAGQRIEFAATLERPRPAGNPGEFDFAAHLHWQVVHYRATLREGDPLALGRVEGGSIVRLAAAARRRLEAALAAAVPGDAGALLAGLLVGSRSELPDAVQDDFRAAGILHLLAVSGSNVAFVALPCLGLLRWLRVPRAAALGATGAAIGAFALVTGASPSVVRAAAMACIALAAAVAGRSPDPLAALAAAGFGQLLWRPATLFDAGFQLSFAATAGILAYALPLATWLGRLRSPPPADAPHAARAARGGGSALGGLATAAWARLGAPALAATIAAQAGVLPVQLAHFGALSLAALPANLVALPLVAVLVPLGGLVCVADLIWPPAAVALGVPAEALARLLVGAASAIAALPYAEVVLPAPPPPLVVAYAAVAARAAGWWAPAWLPSPARWRRPQVAIALLLALVVGAATAALADPPGTLEVTFLDVGQGDAIFIRFPGGATMLIDGGGRPADGRPGFDAAERVVLPFLRRRGISSLDAVVLSHPHQDHVGGLAAVVAAVPARRAWHAADAVDLAALGSWLERVRRAGAVVSVPKVGEDISPDRRASLWVLSPPLPPYQGTRSDVNANSLVLRLDYGEVSVLLTGDAEDVVERDLLRHQPLALPAAVLKVAHQGSDHSSGAAFLAAVRPAYAVVSVGPNPFGHPSPSALARLRQAGAAVLRTDVHGAITVKTDGRGVEVMTFRSSVPFDGAGGRATMNVWHPRGSGRTAGRTRAQAGSGQDTEGWARVAGH